MLTAHSRCDAMVETMRRAVRHVFARLNVP